jgi:serine/threonine protein kinase
LLTNLQYPHKGVRDSHDKVVIYAGKGLQNWKVLGIVRAPMPVLGHTLNDPFLTPLARGGSASVFLSRRPGAEPLIVKLVSSRELAQKERDIYERIEGVQHTCTLAAAGAEWGEFAVVLNELSNDDIGHLAECIRLLHERHVLHADIRESNIMRAANGDIMLLDFGFSKVYPFQEGFYSGTLSTASDQALRAMSENIPYTPSFADDW